MTQEFNKNLKMGCYEDDFRRYQFSKSLCFATMKSEGKDISLDEYSDRMRCSGCDLPMQSTHRPGSRYGCGAEGRHRPSGRQYQRLFMSTTTVL